MADALPKLRHRFSVHSFLQNVSDYSFKMSVFRFFLHIYFCLPFFLLLQNSEKQMRQLAVIPPMLFDAEQQRIKFINMNGLMDDPMKVYKDRQVMNMWSEQEKDTFREKYVLHSCAC